jgi:hypothetical protein
MSPVGGAHSTFSFGLYATTKDAMRCEKAFGRKARRGESLCAKQTAPRELGGIEHEARLLLSDTATLNADAMPASAEQIQQLEHP